MKREQKDCRVPLRRMGLAGMGIGKDHSDPVLLSYKAKAPVAFTGKIEKVTVDVK